MCGRGEYTELYHERSNIETAFSMIKGKFVSALRTERDTGQIKEALRKVLAHNVCVLAQAVHELGIEPLFVRKSGLHKIEDRGITAPVLLLAKLTP